MDDVAEHLRATWSHLGLEVRGSGQHKVTVAVGPVFPVSQLCADVAARFDAEVTIEFDNDQGTMLVVKRQSDAVHYSEPSVWPQTLVAACAVACIKALFVMPTAEQVWVAVNYTRNVTGL